jgi:hypothetical protein
VTVQRLMGHVNIRDTLRYSHLTPAIKTEAVMLLDQPAPTADAPRDRGRRPPTPTRRRQPSEATRSEHVPAEKHPHHWV